MSERGRISASTILKERSLHPQEGNKLEEPSSSPYPMLGSVGRIIFCPCQFSCSCVKRHKLALGDCTLAASPFPQISPAHNFRLRQTSRPKVGRTVPTSSYPSPARRPADPFERPDILADRVSRCSIHRWPHCTGRPVRWMDGGGDRCE